MGKYQGVKEKLHYPIYDSFFVPGTSNATFADSMTDPRMLRFFIDVQNKTRLETNLQASGVLPSLNTLEVRAMRVVVSPVPVAIEGNRVLQIAERYRAVVGSPDSNQEAILAARNRLITEMQDECDRNCAGASLILSELIYNSVTTLLVGEKTSIEAPPWLFPRGAGIHPGNGRVSNHGEPDPMATFRFAEPVIINPQQNVRGEIMFPQGVPTALANVTGPFRIWMLLDGYLTRDVQ